MNEWMNKKCVTTRKTKSELWKLYKGTKSYCDYMKYTICLEQSNYKFYKKAKRDFERNLVKNVKENHKSK